MRDIKEILRQKWQLGLSHRTIAVALKVSAGAVGETVRRAKQAGLCDFAAVDAMAPSELEAKLYPSALASTRPQPDCAWIHRERRGVGVTLQLQHLEPVSKLLARVAWPLERDRIATSIRS